jgi:hypothetical protein
VREVRVRESGGVHAFKLGGSRALPRRGARCLAAARGELGQKKRDKKRGWGCARQSMAERGGLWRSAASEGGRSAWREDAELAHARCSTPSRPSEHARGRPRKTGQGRWRAWEGLVVGRGG